MNNMLLRLSGIELNFGNKHIFSFPEFMIYENEKIGLVGLNGSGKSTLLNIMAGQCVPDKGEVQRVHDIAYFRQFEDVDTLSDKQIDVNTSPEMLKRLQVSHLEYDITNSGGEKTRFRLAKLFSESHQLILFDEPTSNLDLAGIKWLKEELTKCSAFVLVSHDVSLLNAVCKRIVEIREHKLYFYEGNYDAYRQQLEQSIMTKQRQYEAYVEEKRRLQMAYTKRKEYADNLMKKAKERHSSSDYKTEEYASSKPGASKQKQLNRKAKSLLSRIEHLEVKEKPKREIPIQLDFSRTNPPRNPFLIRAENFSFAYGEHSIFANSSFLVRNGQKVAIIGKNGCGKTTLLRCMANRHEAMYIAEKIRFGLLYQEFENLPENMTIIDVALAESVQTETVVRAVLSRLLFTEQDLHKSVAVLSGGEKIRLSLAKLIVSDANVIILDEPTNYLDTPSIEVLISLLKSYAGTVIFVSHDRHFIDEVATDLLAVYDKKVQMFHGNLSSYEQRKTLLAENITAQKTLLEMKLARLAGKLHRASDEEKILLEQEYQNTVLLLREIQTYKLKAKNR